MEWINVKTAYPPFGEVVEVYVEKLLTGIRLDYAAYMKGDSYDKQNYWTREGMCDYEWDKKGFNIKYWRPLGPLPTGKKPYFTTRKDGYIKVVFKKI